MESLTVGVVGSYKSGKTTLVNKLQQRKGAEEDVSFYYLKYAGKNLTLIDTPGDSDAPQLVASVLSVSDAVILCLSPDTGINFQVGEILVMINTLGVSQGLICITKVDMSTRQEVEKLKANIAALAKGTSIEKFEVIEININDDQSIADTRAKLAQLKYDMQKLSRPFKFAVDNAFESKGMSIAVGTLIDGSVSVHSDGIITPDPFTKEVSINSIQINQEDAHSADAGERIGVGIKGVWPWDLPRGVEIRTKGSYRDVKSGTLEINIQKLYKYPIKDDTKLLLVCNWQNCLITLSDVKRSGDVLTASFESDKNFAFDKFDRLLVINKDLPIRVLRVVGKAMIK